MLNISCYLSKNNNNDVLPRIPSYLTEESFLKDKIIWNPRNASKMDRRYWKQYVLE